MARHVYRYKHSVVVTSRTLEQRGRTFIHCKNSCMSSLFIRLISVGVRYSTALPVAPSPPASMCISIAPVAAPPATIPSESMEGGVASDSCSLASHSR